MLIPYKVDVPFERVPVVNWVLIGVICIVSFIYFAQPKLEMTQEELIAQLEQEFRGRDESTLTEAEVLAAAKRIVDRARAQVSPMESMVLRNWNPVGLFGHLFLHADIFHLAGNMIFLFVFGNAVCSKLGLFGYPLAFLGLGLVAGASHLMFADGPAIGASGAINGVVGMYLVLFPLNEVSVLYWFGWFWRGVWNTSGIVVTLLWVVFDIVGLVFGGGNVAYHAHLGGFAGGVALGFVLVWIGAVKKMRGETTLADIFGLKPLRRGAGDVEPPPGYERGRKFKSTWRQSGLVNRAPAAEEAPAPPPPPPPPPPQAPPAEVRINFQCACGRGLSAPAAVAGKRAKCPNCGAVVTIPMM